jgi:hypothetical protein
LWQGKVSGHAAIRENLRKLWYDRQHWWYGRQHLMNHFIMDPAARRRAGALLLPDHPVERRLQHQLRVRHRHARRPAGQARRAVEVLPAARQRVDRGRPDPVEGRATLPMRPPYTPEPADTRPFAETRDGW